MANGNNQLVDLPFYEYLWDYYSNNKGRIKKSYRKLTKKFLDYNDPENANSYLWKPQYEALEMYIFLKEYLNNKRLHEIFQAWYNETEEFQGRQNRFHGNNQQLEAFREVDAQIFQAVFNNLEHFSLDYANYIFALTMGVGKTILMGTCIFYEFLLANKFPQDDKYCHNALVFAPDTTVLQSLKEILTFDKSKVVPPEYVSWLNSNLKSHFLDDTGISLNVIDQSDFNIIISNTQKIILKKKHKDKNPAQLLFSDFDVQYKAKTLNVEYDDLYDFDIETDVDLSTNQRFEKLLRLNQLGIYVDEAHHVFGNKLAKDVGIDKSATSLRLTINELATTLEEFGTHVVACYNFTGTPYAKNRLLPEVVYVYTLKDAIDNQYLKKATVNGYTNVVTSEFVHTAITDFWDQHANMKYEGLLPKMAFFASKIDELENELKPAVEEALVNLNIPTDKILVNVGDDKLTSNDDLREFNNLDRPSSQKQFILLVGKGKEGWNCRSLFAVAMYRKPRSKIFVLQATMRCLRKITEIQGTGLIYLSDENRTILTDELRSNFRMTVEEFAGQPDQKQIYQIRLAKDPVKIKLKRIKKLFNIKKKEPGPGIDLRLEEAPTDNYQIIHSQQDIMELQGNVRYRENLTVNRIKRSYSALTLIAEIARYLNKNPIQIEQILDESKDGLDYILKKVNEFNELLYDWIIPHLFNEFYDLEEYLKEEEQEVVLAKEPELGYYEFRSLPQLMAYMENDRFINFKEKSFHLDRYCFDSNPEINFFNRLLSEDTIDKVYFTGMLTHGQSEFKISYIDPVSHTVKNYYPDFLILNRDGSYTIFEVKGVNKIDDAVVKAKAEYANQMAVSSGMTYRIVPSNKVQHFPLLS